MFTRYISKIEPLNNDLCPIIQYMCSSLTTKILWVQVFLWMLQYEWILLSRSLSMKALFTIFPLTTYICFELQISIHVQYSQASFVYCALSWVLNFWVFKHYWDSWIWSNRKVTNFILAEILFWNYLNFRIWMNNFCIIYQDLQIMLDCGTNLC